MPKNGSDKMGVSTRAWQKYCTNLLQAAVVMRYVIIWNLSYLIICPKVMFSEGAIASKLPPKVPGARDSCKVLLHDFKNLDVRSLAKAGQLEFCCYITIIEAFPFPNNKETICWKSVVEAAAKSETLQATLDLIGRVIVVSIKRDLIDYASSIAFPCLNSLVPFLGVDRCLPGEG